MFDSQRIWNKPRLCCVLRTIVLVLVFFSQFIFDTWSIILLSSFSIPVGFPCFCERAQEKFFKVLLITIAESSLVFHLKENFLVLAFTIKWHRYLILTIWEYGSNLDALFKPVESSSPVYSLNWHFYCSSFFIIISGFIASADPFALYQRFFSGRY